MQPGNSLNEVAIKLNSNGYRTNDGNRFTAHSIKDILHNRFYEGKVVFHRGSPEIKVIDGIHEVPPEVKELWLKCQQVRQERRVVPGVLEANQGKVIGIIFSPRC